MATITGTAGRDLVGPGTVIGQDSPSEDADDIFGLGGDDVLNGLQGNDLVDGGEGNDLLRDDDGIDVFVGGAGNDTIQLLDENGQVNGGSGDDVIFGDFANQLGTADEMEGGDDNDRMYGSDGDDFVSGGNGDDLLYGGSGADTVEGGWAPTTSAPIGSGTAAWATRTISGTSIPPTRPRRRTTPATIRKTCFSAMPATTGSEAPRETTCSAARTTMSSRSSERSPPESR